MIYIYIYRMSGQREDGGLEKGDRKHQKRTVVGSRMG